MTQWPAHRLRLEALEKTDVRLAMSPDDIEAHFVRAQLLAELGRIDEARLAYFETLKRSPAHFGALNNLGVLLQRAGYLTAARTVFTETTARHPENPKGRVNLANLLREQGEIDAARSQYEAALTLAPDHAEAAVLVQGVDHLPVLVQDPLQQRAGIGRRLCPAFGGKHA